MATAGDIPDWMNPARNATGRGGSAVPKHMLDSIQKGHFGFSWKGIPTFKNPFDWALYPMLLWEKRPATIFEIGSNYGGSAVWMSDLMKLYGSPAIIHSVDIAPVSVAAPEGVTFHLGDAHDLDAVLSRDLIAGLPRPFLLIEDSSHLKETSLAVLEFFDEWMRPGETVVIEDGIITDMAGPEACNGGPWGAVEEWIGRHPDRYAVDARYCDWFGTNVTWNVNGFLRVK